MKKLLAGFLKERITYIIMCAGFVGIFEGIFYLYSIRTDAVKYAFLLSAVWLSFYGVSDFIRYIRKHVQLLEVEKRAGWDLGMLPEAGSLIEKDYQRILTKVHEEKKDLESQNRIAGQEMVDYYGMWVHQIKTPIAALCLLLQSGWETEDENTLHIVKEMKMELFKIEQYVEMVLTYLRIGNMSSDFTFGQHSLDDIIRQAVRKYSQMFIFGKIKLNYKPVNKTVLTDEKWLVFVIEQILSNALKYTLPCEARPPRACVTGCPDGYTLPCEARSISIYMEKDFLVIEDTGMGIYPEDLPRVFEKGFTGYNGRTDKKSTGIGLYLCKTILDKLQHEIKIESEVGKGTKVYLWLERPEIL